MKKCNTIRELEMQYSKISSNWSDETRFMATALMFIAKILFTNKGKNRKKRQPTKWNKFCAEQMKSGKSIKEISKLYHKN